MEGEKFVNIRFTSLYQSNLKISETELEFADGCITESYCLLKYTKKSEIKCVIPMKLVPYNEE